MPSRLGALAVPAGSVLALVLAGPRPRAVADALAGVAGGHTEPDAAIAHAAAALAWAVALWLAAGATVVVTGTMSGRVGRLADAAARRIVPGAFRGAVRAALGAGVAAGALLPAAPAGAQVPLSPAFTVAVDDAAAVLTARLERPDRSAPTTTAPARSLPQPSAGSTPPANPPGAEPARSAPAAASPDPAAIRGAGAPADVVVVVPGDTLWDIAERRLDRPASAADIDAAWRRWYAANRGVIGADPNLIRPGQRLAPPVTHAPMEP